MTMPDNPQACWDRLLLTVFLQDFNSNNRYLSMYDLVRTFEAMTNVEVTTLKRTPQAFNHRRMSSSRFVCGHLPRLARILIDCNKTAEDIPDLVEKLQKWNIDTVMVDPKSRADSVEKNKSKKAYVAARMAQVGEMEFADKSNGLQHKVGRQHAVRGHLR